MNSLSIHWLRIVVNRVQASIKYTISATNCENPATKQTFSRRILGELSQKRIAKGESSNHEALAEKREVEKIGSFINKGLTWF